jgi:lipopolysaccharide biosynthesis glycosyltransferase
MNHDGYLTSGRAEGSADSHAQTAIAVAADSGFLYPALLALLSAQRHCADSRVSYIFLGVNLSRAEEDFAASVMAGRGLEPGLMRLDPGELSGLPTREAHLPPTAYARLFLPELARATGAARTVYLDSDTLTVGALDDLVRVQLAPHQVCAAVPDDAGTYSCAMTWSHPFTGLAPYLEPGADEPYFNAGVMLIDNAAWKDQGVCSRVLSAVRRGPTARFVPHFADQGWLNLILRGKWLELPSRFNRLVAGFSVPFGRRVVHVTRWSARVIPGAPDTAVLHFAGPGKPWMADAKPGADANLYWAHWLDTLGAPPWERPSLPRWATARLRKEVGLVIGRS